MVKPRDLSLTREAGFSRGPVALPTRWIGAAKNELGFDHEELFAARAEGPIPPLRTTYGGECTWGINPSAGPMGRRRANTRWALSTT